MGFGHRVYRTGDSRVPTMKHYMFKVAKLLKKEKYTQIYDMSSLQQYFSTLDSAYDLKGCSHINQMCFNSKDRQKATLKN